MRELLTAAGLVALVAVFYAGFALGWSVATARQVWYSINRNGQGGTP